MTNFQHLTLLIISYNTLSKLSTQPSSPQSLPNCVGTTCGVDSETYGCFVNTGARGAVGAGSNIKTYWKQINLHNGNSVFQDNASVRPESICTHFLIKY